MWLLPVLSRSRLLLPAVPSGARFVYVSCTRGGAADEDGDGAPREPHRQSSRELNSLAASSAFERLSQKLRREGLQEMLKKREVRPFALRARARARRPPFPRPARLTPPPPSAIRSATQSRTKCGSWTRAGPAT